MSSVLIKGMEMPSECEYCGFCRYYPENGNVWCNAKNRLLKQKWKEPHWTHLDIKRPEWCPLIELPEKHGGLIDADEYLKKMNLAISMLSGIIKEFGAEDDAELQMELKSYRDIRDGIKEEPTIIEAEGDEE